MNGEGRGGLRERRWKENDWDDTYDNCYIDISEVALSRHPGVTEAEWGDDGEDNVTSVLSLLSSLMSAKASYLLTVVLSHFIYCSQDTPLPT